MASKLVVGLAFALSLVPGVAQAQREPAGHEGHRGTAAAPAPGSVHTTMGKLHASGGVPPGWTFTLPAGDAAAGREVFVGMKCYTCHDVAGEKFPAHKRDVGEVGPDLTGMGGHHPAEFFAESILNPNAVILVDDPKFTGPDGLSVMPEYLDSMSLRQLVDLVAYLKSLTPGYAPAVVSEERPRFYKGEGEVRVADAEKDRLVIKHGEIKGFMGPMTMGYLVTPPTLLQGLKPGDKIRFTIDADQRAIVDIKPIRE